MDDGAVRFAFGGKDDGPGLVAGALPAAGRCRWRARCAWGSDARDADGGGAPLARQPRAAPCLHGPTPDHSHARYLPEDRNDDGIIDHLTVFVSGGLDGVAIRLLAMSERLFVPGSGAHDLEPVAMGDEPARPLLGPARIWTSLHALRRALARQLVPGARAQGAGPAEGRRQGSRAARHGRACGSTATGPRARTSTSCGRTRSRRRCRPSRASCSWSLRRPCRGRSFSATAATSDWVSS